MPNSQIPLTTPFHSHILISEAEPPLCSQTAFSRAPTAFFFLKKRKLFLKKNYAKSCIYKQNKLRFQSLLSWKWYSIMQICHFWALRAKDCLFPHDELPTDVRPSVVKQVLTKIQSRLNRTGCTQSGFPIWSAVRLTGFFCLLVLAQRAPGTATATADNCLPLFVKASPFNLNQKHLSRRTAAKEI